MSDDEPVDQKNYLEQSCKPKCVRPLRAYQEKLERVARRQTLNVGKFWDCSIGPAMACIERIKGDESGHKHCTGQYFDYWSCVDACVAPKLFDKLK